MPGWMPEPLAAGGVIMYPLLLTTVAVVALIVLAARRVAAADGADPSIEIGIDAILFWGAFGLIVGAIGTLVGIAQAARAIERLGEANAVIAWGGIKVSLIPTIYALLVFGVAALGWWVLRTLYRRRAGERSAEAVAA